MTVHYVVTFEFDARPAVTHRGMVDGSAASICASRATRLAQRALRPARWSSVVVVLLERVELSASPEPEIALTAEVAS